MSEEVRQQPKKRMLSGIKPSGDLTLGSYLGAIRNWGARSICAAERWSSWHSTLPVVWIPGRIPCSSRVRFRSMRSLAGC